MKTKRLMSLAFAMGILHVVQAQVSIESNFPFSTSPPDYVGWNGSTTIPLEVRHNGNQPIEWYTDSLRRMHLMETDSYDVGGSTSQDKDGFLLLCPDVDQFYSNGAPGPYTTLHLAAADDNAQEAGYRPNMGNGITMTGNDDQMYVGQLFNGLDYTDAAIVWSDNPGEWLADRLTFNFTSNYTAGTGMNSMNGLQTMLIQPDGSGQEAFVGLGDFDAASEVPVERLDVLDGRVRIRQLPTELEMDTSQQYVVVNGDGVLGWRNIPTGTGGADCDWAQDASHNLYTAIAPVNPGSCPDLDNRVAIGNYPSLTAAKLHVEQRPRVGLNETAIKAVALVSGDFVGSQGVAVDASTSPAVGEASATIHYGLKANALNADKENYGVYASASNNGGHTTSQWNVGVYGHGAGDTASYGVYGHASGSGTNYGLHGWAQGSSTNNNFGVYGKVTGGGSGTNYAGYFSGNFHVAGLASCPYNVWS